MELHQKNLLIILKMMNVKTSQPAIGKIISAYEELGKDGSEIISIHCFN
ncbi:hypothetical protein ACVXZZ_14805 [Staphylococcus aureus]